MICLDELGPGRRTTLSRPELERLTAHRPHFRPDYARYGYRWAFGALAHRTGAVFVETVATRDTTAWLHFLDGLETFAPPGDAYLIVDNLPLHWSVDTMLWNWGHPRFHFVPLPKAAAWLNLIEGFWKILRQRALAGRVLRTQHRRCRPGRAAGGLRLESAADALPLGTTSQTAAAAQALLRLPYLRNDALSGAGVPVVWF